MGLREEEKRRPDRISAPEAAEIRRGRWEGPSQSGGAGEERRVLVPPTLAQEACWAPR